MRKPYDPSRDFVIALDPAMIDSGFAMKSPTGYHCDWSGVVSGVENLRHLDPLAYLRTCLVIADKPRLWVLSEYPAWSGHGAEQVRAAANCWFRYIDGVAGKTQVITAKVGPSTWQSQYLGIKVVGKNREEPKPVYMAKALTLTGRKEIDENEAAATCLLDFALQDLAKIVPILFALKTKKVKA